MSDFTQNELARFTGEWIAIADLLKKRDIVVGDLVMYEAQDTVEVEEVLKIDDAGVLWANNWAIPRSQIISVKLERTEKLKLIWDLIVERNGAALERLAKEEN